MDRSISALERNALAFILNMRHSYLETRDLPAVLAGMTPDISWIGTGPEEGCSSLLEAEAALSREFQEYAGPFFVSDSRLLTRQLSDRACLVYGSFSACPDTPELADQVDRISAVCIQTEQGMRLAHLHISHPDPDQVDGEYYVRRSQALNRQAQYTCTQAASHKLEAHGRDLALLTEHIPGGIYQCKNDPDFPLISVTNVFLSLVGYTREELHERFQDCFARIILPEDLAHIHQTLREQTADGDVIEVEYRIRRGDGELMWVLDKGKRVVMEDGTDTFYCMLLDITAQRREREELRLSLERHQIIMDQAADIIFEWDIRQDTLVFSQNWRKKFGYIPINRQISRRIPFSKNICPDDIPAFVQIMKDISAGLPYSETEFRIRDILGHFIWCRIRATAQYDNAGQAIKAVGVILDIDEDKKARQRLIERAQRDSLTGLLNKDAARSAVESALCEEQLGQGVLLIIDLDDFKAVNDRYGHLTGDKVLLEVSLALKRLFRSDDIVARIGGDEFLAYLPGAPVSEAERKAQAILQAFQQIPILGRTGLVSCSVGAAANCQDTHLFVELYRCADMALYQIKNTGKHSFALYSPELCAQGPDGGIISSVSAAIDSNADSINTTLGEYCFRLLCRAIEPVAAVEQILEVVGRAYDVSRVYIFESSEDGLRCSNTFEWCNEGVSPEIDRLQNLSYREDLGNYTANFGQDGVFYCGDIHTLHPDVYAILASQGIRSLLQCAIVDDGQFKGYVGFDECRDNRHWTKAQIDTLTMVSNVLSTFLVKLRLKQRLSRLTRGGAPGPQTP